MWIPSSMLSPSRAHLSLQYLCMHIRRQKDHRSASNNTEGENAAQIASNKGGSRMGSSRLSAVPRWLIMATNSNRMRLSLCMKTTSLVPDAFSPLRPSRITMLPTDPSCSLPPHEEAHHATGAWPLPSPAPPLHHSLPPPPCMPCCFPRPQWEQHVAPQQLKPNAKPRHYLFMFCEASLAFSPSKRSVAGWKKPNVVVVLRLLSHAVKTDASTVHRFTFRLFYYRTIC